MLRLRHAGRLFGDLTSYAVVNRVWWVLPLVLLLLVLVLLAFVGQATVPYTLYTLI